VASGGFAIDERREPRDAEGGILSLLLRAHALEEEP
jgi:hypothetical protein